MPLTEEQKEIVRSIAPILKENGKDVLLPQLMLIAMVEKYIVINPDNI
jgi:hemoglobin-like flavoprotein